MPTRRALVLIAALLAATAVLLGFVAPRPVTAQTESVHLALGNPSGAAPDPAQPANYLIARPQYALGYLRDDGIARWVSWRLVAADLGPAERSSSFTRDTTLPTGWYRVGTTDYTNSGYDRGHMVSSEDRTASDADNQATFIMTNVVPQSPQNNRGPWLRLEELGRDLASLGDEVYIVAGPEGELARLAAGRVRVPATTWKALLAAPAGPGAPVERVTTATRVVAISIPNDKDNTQVRQTDDWQQYTTTVDAIEAATGLDLFAALSPTVQRVIEARPDVGALPYTLAVSGTATLSTTLGAPFAPLAVRVTGPAGEPLPGLSVTFAALGAAANADLGGDVIATVVTDADGVATLTPRANQTTGSYRIEASLAGVFTPATFTLTNAEPAAAPMSVVYLPAVVR